MDLEAQMRAQPVLATAFVLAGLMGGVLLLGFVAQWNRYSLLERSLDGFRREREKLGVWRAAVKWFVVGELLAAVDVWRESRGIRFVVLLGLGCCVLAWALFRLLVQV